jgi:hypothetical protein
MQDREASLPKLALGHACCFLPRHYTGTHRGQILSAKPFEGGTVHTCWIKLKCLSDKLLIKIEALAMVSGVHLVVGETLIAQHDCGCWDS